MVQIERRIESQAEAAERRLKDRIRKQKSRERIAATRPVAFEVWVWDWSARYEEHAAELREHEQEFTKAVSAELGRDISREPGDADFALNRLIVCLVALRKKDRPWVCKTDRGMTAAGRYLMEDIATDLIRDSYRQGLKQSPTYTQALHELLTLLLEFEFPNGMARSERLIIEQELSGVYEYIPRQLPKRVEPVIEAPKEEPLPSYRDHMAAQAEKLLRQISEDQESRREQMIEDGSLPYEARKYLGGF